MIPYTLLVTSASRPHCLGPTLRSLDRFCDQAPEHVFVHDDVVEPDLGARVHDAVRSVGWGYDATVLRRRPAQGLGLALAWLLDQPIETDYVLYSQDDHVAVRPLPIRRALSTMDAHGLHHIRFNKRATRAIKDTWQGPWAKEEREFSADPAVSQQIRANHLFADPTGALPAWHCGSAGCDGHGQRVTLTVSDHWHFQLSLWRVTVIRQALDFWRTPESRWIRFTARNPEETVNYYFDHVAYGGDPLDPRVRATCQRTFIWGPIGEDRYVRHIGGAPDDWRGGHARDGGVDDPETAWREILSYPNTEGLRG